MVETDELCVYFSLTLFTTSDLPHCTGGVERHLRKGQEEMANSFNHQIQQLGQDISRKLDCIAAVTSKCLLVSVENDIPCPRLIMVSEDVSPGSAPSSLSHFRREMVDKLLPRVGPAPQCYRIRFLCAYDLTAATCGEDGLGYKVEIQGWQKWLKACLPVFKVSFNIRWPHTELGFTSTTCTCRWIEITYDRKSNFSLITRMPCFSGGYHTTLLRESSLHGYRCLSGFFALASLSLLARISCR